MEILDKELHRISSTAIIYNDEGKFLVTRRSLNKKAFPGKWTVPGGGLSVDDYINTPKNQDGLWYNATEIGLRREVLEEIGLETEKFEYLCDITFIRPDNIPVLILSYFTKYKSGEVELDEDTIDYKWVSIDEAKEIDLISGIWEELKLVDDILKDRKLF
ncbi:MAG: NUDIX hydrolase [Candidatus Nomurabacteria bacterium]